MAAHVMPGLLKVLIEGAHGLDNLVPGGQQHPYYVLQCGAWKSRSKAAAHGTGTHPVWHSAHKFELSNEVVMKIIVKDEVTKGVIGEALIDLAR